MKSLTSKAGTFRAVCGMGEHLPYADCTPEQIAAAEESGHKSRWDYKRKCEVIAVVCAETITDPAEFERHMAQQHGRKVATWPSSKGIEETLGRSIRRGWKAPALKPDGRPFKTSAQYGLVECCDTCGLVADVRDNAGELWWREHVAGCALAAAS